MLKDKKSLIKSDDTNKITAKSDVTKAIAKSNKKHPKMMKKLAQ